MSAHVIYRCLRREHLHRMILRTMMRVLRRSMVVTRSLRLQVAAAAVEVVVARGLLDAQVLKQLTAVLTAKAASLLLPVR